MQSQLIGRILGPSLFVVVGFLINIPGLEPTGCKVLGLALWMAVWWASEATAIPVTALLPICFLPWFGATSLRDTTEAYGHPLIFLFLGGFMLALAMQRSGLHKRFALLILTRMSGSSNKLILGFMMVAALLSMWVTNTATTMMMTPIGMSVIALVRSQTSSPQDQRRFANALLLGIAYAATIGGLGTLVGTVPNTLLAGFVVDQVGYKISFASWMILGIPMIILFIPICWLLLTRFIFPTPAISLRGSSDLLSQMLRDIGPIRRDEKRVLMVFLATAFFWSFRPLIQKYLITDIPLSDTGIAISAGILLFLIPKGSKISEGLMDWKTAKNLPWDLLLMFGGGLALAGAVKSSGVSLWLGSGIAAMPITSLLLLMAIVTTLTIFVTELTSNTATTATFLPVILSVANGLSIEPLYLLVPTAVAASCAFMLPVATPPNAVVYGSGEIAIKDMMRAGFWLNIVAVGLVTMICYFLVPLVFGS